MSFEHCQPEGRHYRLPNKQIAACFVDFDGTIAECQPHFEQASNLFGRFMQRCGFDKKLATTLLSEYDYANVSKHGFKLHRLAESMMAVYSKLCKDNGKRVNKDDLLICEEIGRSPFFKRPRDFEDALAVLEATRPDFLMVLVTIGNHEAQSYKVNKLGRSSLFDEIIITGEDNKEELVANMIEDCNINPDASFFIGNSLRSDGACYKHTNFIYLPLEGGWKFDQAELPKDTGFKFIQAKDWREAQQKGINRFLHRRLYR